MYLDIRYPEIHISEILIEFANQTISFFTNLDSGTAILVRPKKFEITIAEKLMEKIVRLVLQAP